MQRTKETEGINLTFCPAPALANSTFDYGSLKLASGFVFLSLWLML